MSVDDYEHHRPYIIAHEQEHIRLGHSYDLLLLETVCVLQWFNPFVWLLGHELKAVHEYAMDEALLYQGIDAKQYQKIIVTKAARNRLQPFANNLRHGSLKQRIIMMYRKIKPLEDAQGLLHAHRHRRGQDSGTHSKHHRLEPSPPD